VIASHVPAMRSSGGSMSRGADSISCGHRFVWFPQVVQTREIQIPCSSECVIHC
jgi:hypothetical protein